MYNDDDCRDCVEYEYDDNILYFNNIRYVDGHGNNEHNNINNIKMNKSMYPKDVNNNNSDFDKFNYEEEFEFKFIYDEDVKYVRETKNSQESIYVKNKNLCSGYFCDYIPLIDKNNDLQI